MFKIKMKTNEKKESSKPLDQMSFMSVSNVTQASYFPSLSLWSETTNKQTDNHQVNKCKQQKESKLSYFCFMVEKSMGCLITS